MTHHKGECRLSKHSHCTVTGRDMFRHIQIRWEQWSDTWQSVTGATGVPARNSLRLWNKERFSLTGSLITSSLSGQTASTVGRLLYYSHSGCFSLRENNNDKDCRLLTAFSNPPPPPHAHTALPSVFSPRWKRQVIPALWARVTPEKKNKGITGRISCSSSWQVFPSFLADHVWIAEILCCGGD